MNTISSSDNQASTTITPKQYGKIILTLNNGVLPAEKLAQTPSRIDGIDEDTETDLRIWGCELIQTAGILLRLPQITLATGQVLFQRFYYSKSFIRHSAETTAMACVCLASKLEEEPRNIHDIINVFNHIKQITKQRIIQPVIFDQSYARLKLAVIYAERHILKELGFCVHVKHPHKIIVMYLRVLGLEENSQLMQVAWNYMNDSLRTDICVRYEPEVIACACIYLTARKLQIPLPMDPAWFTVFGANEVDLKDISVRILRLYKRPKINNIELERKVEDMRKTYREKKLLERKMYQEKQLMERVQNEKKPLPDNNNSLNSQNASHNALDGFISQFVNHIVPNNDEQEQNNSSSCITSLVSGSNDNSKRCRSRSRTGTGSKTREIRKSSWRRRSRSKENYSRNNQRDRSKNRRLSKSRSRSSNERKSITGGTHKSLNGFGNHTVTKNHENGMQSSCSRTTSPISRSNARKRYRSNSRTRLQYETHKISKYSSSSSSRSVKTHSRNKQRECNINRRVSKSRSWSSNEKKSSVDGPQNPLDVSDNYTATKYHENDKQCSRSSTTSSVSAMNTCKRYRSKSRTRLQSKTDTMRKYSTRRRSRSKENHSRNKRRDRRVSKSRSRSSGNNNRRSRYRSDSYDKYRERSSSDRSYRYNKNDYEYNKNDKYNDYHSKQLSKTVPSSRTYDNDRYHDKYSSHKRYSSRSDHYHTEAKFKSNPKSKKYRKG